MSLAPEYILEDKMDNDKLTLNLTLILHGTTQTRCIVVYKTTATPHNPQQRLLSSLGVKWV